MGNNIVFKFKPWSCSYDGHWKLTWSLTSGPVGLVEHKFLFWYPRRTQTSYEDNIRKIVEFSSVCYCHLARPSLLPTSPTDLHLFKQGIRPLWEDSANCNGGEWIIRFKKVVSGRFWEDLNHFIWKIDVMELAVMSCLVYHQTNCMLMARNIPEDVMALRDAIKRHSKLPHSYVMDYKPHDASLRDNSSYRNTSLRGWKYFDLLSWPRTQGADCRGPFYALASYQNFFL
ncbi:hypothetical protein NC653_041031 [Populus alba x Populus x berolinensis]|uniref:mRNA cap-binding protein n=1 Tax=Populus alba x Populus x berolinensis TaxID=444605 RepID=A0AAD6PPF9_9ROSI|nr:hypothetical protein NC653_041031 [Populus alba x Populus x berolinensis]